MVRNNDVEAMGAKEEIPHDHLFKVTGLSSTNLEKLAEEPPSSDFEDAISATGYGKFNVVLMLCSLPGFWAACSVTSAVSYTFTRAQCDMNLSMLDMGTVSAMTYAGMISSAMVWGFLSDTLGRRQIMVYGYITSGLVDMVAAMSQNFPMLLVARFTCGFLFNGPFAVMFSYIAELHRTDLRARVILLSSLFYTLANVTLPLLAWAFLIHTWDYNFFNGWLVIHSWNLFLLATAFMPFLSGLCFMCLPESPKFLMSRGRNEEAMAVFRKIYAINTGKPADSYPVKSLVVEKSEQQGQGMAALRGGGAQLKPLFKMPHLKWLMLICTIHVGCMFGTNTLRLWYPQLAAMIGSSQGLCAAVAPTTAPDVEAACVPIETDMLTYMQSVAVGSGSVITYIIGGVIVNKCGKKLVTGACAIASAVIVVMLPYLGHSAAAVTVMMTTYLAFTSLVSATLSSICVDLFPTSLRVMALATFLMCGRMGTIVGTVIFPALMDFGCYAPFITIAATLSICGGACSLVPNTTLKKLE